MRFLLLFLVFLLPSAEAPGHAFVIRSTPSANQTVPGPDLAIEVQFNSRINARFSRLTLIGPNGASADLPVQAVSAANAVTATARGLAPGTYRLRWQTLSVDGHLTQGDIVFRVRR